MIIVVFRMPDICAQSVITSLTYERIFSFINRAREINGCNGRLGNNEHLVLVNEYVCVGERYATNVVYFCINRNSRIFKTPNYRREFHRSSIW